MAANTEEQVNLNLDTVEREQSYAPFAVVVGGRRIVLTDPSDLDWKDLLKINDPSAFLRHCCGPDDREFIRRQNIPGWKFNEMMRLFQEHYGIADLGNANGSPT